MKVIFTKYSFSKGRYKAFVPSKKNEFFRSTLQELVVMVKYYLPIVNNIDQCVFEVSEEDLKTLFREDGVYREQLLSDDEKQEVLEHF